VLTHKHCLIGRHQQQMCVFSSRSRCSSVKEASSEVSRVTTQCNNVNALSDNVFTWNYAKTTRKHWWYNLREDMDCGDIFPVFLLYNEGELTGFGWAITTYINSDRYEHPPSSSSKFFMQNPPKCLESDGEMTTMHIYLNSSPWFNTC
ncbi:unnamed protein product, partial [Candidula unifasciata]